MQSQSAALDRRIASWDFWALLLVALAVLASVKYHAGGWLWAEPDLYMVDHLSDRSFLSKILCPNALDAAYYQSRPLDHLLEFIDAHFIYYCTLAGHPHFLSLTSYLLIAGLCLVNWHFARKILGHDPSLLLLVLLLFWTTTVIFLGGVHLRSGKSGVAFLSTLLIWRLVAHLRRAAPGAIIQFKWQHWAEVFLLVIGLCLMDPQGGYISLACLATVGAFLLTDRRRVALSICVAAALALAGSFLWVRIVDPFLIRHVNGFDVSYSYGLKRWHSLRYNTLQSIVTFHLWEGLTLVLDSIRFYLGNVPRVLASFVFGFAVYVAHKTTAPMPAALRLRWMPGFGLGSLGVMTWFILAIPLNIVLLVMLPGAGEDLRRVLYVRIPTGMLVLLGATFFVHRLHTFGWVSRSALRGILIALLVSNVLAIPSHDEIGRIGYSMGYREATPIMIDALKQLVRLPRPAVIEKRYDFSRNARTPLKRALRAGPKFPEIRTDQDYLNSSHYYNFMRSQYGLPFVQE